MVVFVPAMTMLFVVFAIMFYYYYYEEFGHFPVFFFTAYFDVTLYVMELIVGMGTIATSTRPSTLWSWCPMG